MKHHSNAKTFFKKRWILLSGKLKYSKQCIIKNNEFHTFYKYINMYIYYILLIVHYIFPTDL